MRIETTIKGGLPVIASGEVVKCGPYDYPGHDYIDSLEVRFKSGHLFTEELSDADSDRVVRELFEADRSV